MSTSTDTTSPAPPIRTTPFPPLPPRFGDADLANLQLALQSNHLSYLRAGGFVEQAMRKAERLLNAPHAVATSSGTAALHVAVAAVGVQPGDEVITSPITDMGSAIAILYQNAIPVFADVDPQTYNLTPESVAAAITPRTRAVMVIHLMGNPVDMDGIRAVCQPRGIRIIEDCAQAAGATWKNKPVGTIGDIGAYSFNDFKHLSCGDGGMVVTNDRALYERAHNFADKYYDRLRLGVRLQRLGPNYRMSELQGAVLLNQFDKLESIAATRKKLGDRFTAGITGLPGILPHRVLDGASCSYWFHMFRIDETVVGMSREAFSVRLKEQGIPAGAGYIARPLHREPVFVNKNFFEGGVWPAERIAGQTYDYDRTLCPTAEQVLKSSIRLPLHEGMTEREIDDMVAAIRLVARG